MDELLYPLQDGLDSLSGEPPWIEEEWKLSTPYSDVKAWEWVLEAQYLVGSHYLKGPAGLWEKVVAQVDAEGIDVARERHLQGKMANGDAYHSPAEPITAPVSNRLTDSEIESLRQEAKLADLQIQALLAGMGAGAPKESGP